MLFDLPKRLDLNQPLLCTLQFKQLLKSLIVWESSHQSCCVYSLFIFAGPSGIGKSHISYLIAVSLYAIGRPVLYIPDAGALMEDATKSYLLSIMIKTFLKANLDIMNTEMSKHMKICYAFMS